MEKDINEIAKEAKEFVSKSIELVMELLSTEFKEKDYEWNDINTDQKLCNVLNDLIAARKGLYLNFPFA